MTATATKTARFSLVNQEHGTVLTDGSIKATSLDLLTILDASGEELAQVWVESSEDDAPYLAALAAAGHADATLTGV